MFAHQVIEALQDDDEWIDRKILNQVSSYVNEAQKFYVGNYHGFMDLISNNAVKDFPLETPTIIKMPYQKTYIDGEIIISLSEAKKNYKKMTNDEKQLCQSTALNGKFAYLIITLEEDLFCVFTLFYKRMYMTSTNKQWTLFPAMTLLSVNGKVLGDFDIGYHVGLPDSFINNLKNYFIAEIKFGNIDEDYENALKASSGNANTALCKFLYCFCSFMICKNITTETIPAPDKLNRKRIKQGKQPLFSYHTLVIKPVGKRQESIPKHLWENRIHLQRGHFKTYTADKPLFGHITGRFWWQPHVRGRNKNGVVMKDYEVRGNIGETGLSQNVNYA